MLHLFEKLCWARKEQSSSSHASYIFEIFNKEKVLFFLILVASFILLFFVHFFSYVFLISFFLLIVVIIIYFIVYWEFVISQFKGYSIRYDLLSWWPLKYRAVIEKTKSKGFMKPSQI